MNMVRIRVKVRVRESVRVMARVTVRARVKVRVGVRVRAPRVGLTQPRRPSQSPSGRPAGG